MLRTIRLTLAIVFFAIITLLFLDFSGTLHGYMGWMAKIQFLPALPWRKEFHHPYPVSVKQTRTSAVAFKVTITGQI